MPRRLPAIFRHLPSLENFPTIDLLYTWEEGLLTAFWEEGINWTPTRERTKDEAVLHLREILEGGSLSGKFGVLGFVEGEGSDEGKIFCALHNPDTLHFLTFPFLQDGVMILPHVLAGQIEEKFKSL